MEFTAYTVLITIVSFAYIDRAGGYHHYLPLTRTLIVTMRDCTTYVGSLQNISESGVPLWMQDARVRPRDFHYFLRLPQGHFESTLALLDPKKGHNITIHGPAEVEINMGEGDERYGNEFSEYNVEDHDYNSYGIYLSLPRPNGKVYTSGFWPLPPWVEVPW